MSALDHLNSLISSDYDTPDCVESGYRIWFRGYIASAYNTHLVGIAIAWPEPPLPPIEERRYFACVTKGEPQEYSPGGDLRPARYPLEAADLCIGQGRFRDAKDEAITKLRAFVVRSVAS